MNTEISFDLAAELTAVIVAAGAMFEVRDTVAGTVAIRTAIEREARGLAETWNGEAGRERYRVLPA